MKIIKNKALQFLLVSSFMILILRIMGRVYWCSCGQFYLWSDDVNSSHNSQHLLDAYSFSHFQHGLFFYFILQLVKLPYFFAALIFESLWEIIENTPFVIERYRSATFSLNYYGDSIFNSVGDLLSCALGFYLCSRISWKIMLVVYLLIEIIMLFTIRDSLTLNVIMLLYPLQTIKNWQMAI